MNPQFSMANRKRENHHKLAPFCFTAEFWGEWVQRQLWRLPRNEICFAASHFTVVAVLLVKNSQLKCLRGVLQAVVATPQTWKLISASLYSIFWWRSATSEKKRKKWMDFVKQKRAKWDSAICSVHFKPEDIQCLFTSLPGQSTPYIPRLNRDNFGVAAFPTIHAVGKVIKPPQSERNKRKVRWFDTLFHCKLFLSYFKAPIEASRQYRRQYKQHHGLVVLKVSKMQKIPHRKLHKKLNLALRLQRCPTPRSDMQITAEIM